MIFIGYPGVGKSTLAYHNKTTVIDLESSMYLIDGKREDGMFNQYCTIAENLSRNGLIVMVSSHDDVQSRLKHSDERVIACFPDESLKEQWIRNLRFRFERSGLDKDKRALERAEEHYVDDIKALRDAGFENIVLEDMNYDLDKTLHDMGILT